jgi:hypothetical protein
MIFAATQLITSNVLIKLLIGCILYLIALFIITNVFGDILSKTAKGIILAILLIDATYMIYTSIKQIRAATTTTSIIPTIPTNFSNQVEKFYPKTQSKKPIKSTRFNVVDSIKLIKNKKFIHSETSESMPGLIPLTPLSLSMGSISLTDF